MRKGKAPFFLSLMLISFCMLNFSHAASNEVYIIQLNDVTINPITADYISRAIRYANTNDAQCLIIELDTPGGLLSSTRTIVKAMMASKIPIIVYIYPSGSRAGSAGVFITYASHVAAMAPTTNIGAAHPVTMGGGKTKEKKELGETITDVIKAIRGKNEAAKEVKDIKKITSQDNEPMADKILNDTVAFIKSMAKERNRNIEWAELSVTKSQSITEEEALQKNVVEIIAKSENDLLEKLEGRIIKVGGQDIELKTKNAVIKRIEMDFRQRFLNVLANPNIAYILMILGFYGLLYEVTHPGIGVPGVMGLIFIILAFFSMQTLPTNYAGLALIILSVVLFIAEAHVPGFGLLTLGGVICMILGSLILFDSSAPMMRVSLSVILPFTLTTAAITFFLIRIVISSHKKKVLSGKEGLIGMKGEARNNIPAGRGGKVFVHGEIWNAESSQEIKKGAKICVIKVDGMTLTVEKISKD